MMKRLYLIGLAVVLLAAPVSQSKADVDISISIPTPHVSIGVSPPLVVVPQTGVYYVPNSRYNVFWVESRFYLFDDEEWFCAYTADGPWVFVDADQLPQPLFYVPIQYYRAPPSYWRAHRRHDHPPWSEWRSHRHERRQERWGRPNRSSGSQWRRKQDNRREWRQHQKRDRREFRQERRAKKHQGEMVK